MEVVCLYSNKGLRLLGRLKVGEEVHQDKVSPSLLSRTCNTGNDGVESPRKKGMLFSIDCYCTYSGWGPVSWRFRCCVVLRGYELGEEVVPQARKYTPVNDRQ